MRRFCRAPLLLLLVATTWMTTTTTALLLRRTRKPLLRMSETVELFVKNVDYDASAEQLREAFERVCSVTSVAVPVERETGRGRGYAFVRVEGPDLALALSLNETVLGTRTLQVEVQKQRQPVSDSRVLNERIINAASGDAILAIHASGVEMTPVNLATACSRVAKLGAATSVGALVEDATRSVLEGRWGARGLSSASVAVAKMEISVGSCFFDAVAGQHEKVPEFNAQELANTAWAFAKAAPGSTMISAIAREVPKRRPGDFKPQEVANLAWSFATCRTEISMVFLRAASLEVMSELKPQELANLAWAFARLGDDSLKTEIRRAASRLIGEFKPQESSNVAWAFAKFIAMGPSNVTDPEDEAFFGALASAVDLQRCEALHLANLAWSYAKAGTAPWFLRSIAGEARLGKVKDMSPQALANLAWALARVKSDFPDEVLPDIDFIVAEAEPRLHEFNAQDFANTAWALATFESKDEEFAVLLASACSSKIIDQLAPQALASTAWAFGRLGWSNNEDLQLKLARAAAAKMDQLEPSTLASLAASLTQAATTSSSSSFFSALCLRMRTAEEATMLVKNLSPRALATTARALVRTSSPNVRNAAAPLMAAIAVALKNRVRELRPRELSDVAWAYASSGMVDEDLFREIASVASRKMGHRRRLFGWSFVVFLEGREGELHKHHLANMAWAFATAGFPAPALYKTLAEAARSKIGDFSTQELAITAWAFATAGEHGPSSSALFEAVSEHLSLEDLAPLESCQLAQVLIFLDLVDENSSLRKLLATRRSELRASLADEETSPSRTQREVSRALTRIGWEHVSEHLTDEGLSLDMAQPDSKLAVEFDGPWHYHADLNGSKRAVSNPREESDSSSSRRRPVAAAAAPQGRLNGRSLAKRRTLKRLGWRVLYLPYFKWDALSDRKAQEEYLRRKLYTELALSPASSKKLIAKSSLASSSSSEIAAAPASSKELL